MNTILFDDEQVRHLSPLSLTRPAALFRCGILTIAEKWEILLNRKVSFITQPHLSVKYPAVSGNDNLYINGRLFPQPEIIDVISSLEAGQGLVKEGVMLAFRSGESLADTIERIAFHGHVALLERMHQVFTLNHGQIHFDFDLLTKGKSSLPLSKTNAVIGSYPVFLEEGARAEASVFNTTDGPVYLGRDSEVMEGSLIRGPFALCEHATVKMGAKIYSGTTIGPHSKVGGEVSNSVIFGYSNKGHDGFLGNSVLGEWCNMGADSNNSNLKNNYEQVKLWNYETGNFEKTGLQFCGLFMGDHSKCGINTMFNTGTVVGVSANIFGSGFPRNFIPSFSWGGSSGFETYQPKKAFQTAEIVMERREIALTEQDKDILNYIFNEETKYRTWEK
jgi:UDP-N-acetylglucosamine diphosphorylase/glucosamine-1-phosphate N-acetyltransferase